MNLTSLRNLAAAAGFPDPDLAAAVAAAESAGDPFALGDSGNSYGLWQIHVPSHPEWRGREHDLWRPEVNASAALTISSGGKNWQPWTTYRSGAYRKYMPTRPSSAPPAGDPA